MKKIMLIGMIGIFSCALFSVVNANNASPTKKCDIVIVDDLSIVAPSVEVIDIVNYIPSTDLIAGQPLEIAYMPKVKDAEYKMPSNLRNKYHPWYLFNPLKLC